MVAKDKKKSVPSENCPEIGFLGQLTHPIIYAAVFEYC